MSRRNSCNESRIDTCICVHIYREKENEREIRRRGKGIEEERGARQ